MSRLSRADEKKRVGSETSKTCFASVTRKNVLSPKETFMEDVWDLVSVISEKKVVPSCLL